jgi:hypothetical protein
MRRQPIRCRSEILLSVRHSHGLDYADSSDVSRSEFVWPIPHDRLLTVQLHVPFPRCVKTEVPFLAIALALEEQLRLGQPGPQAPVGRSLAVACDPEADDRAAVFHGG